MKLADEIKIMAGGPGSGPRPGGGSQYPYRKPGSTYLKAPLPGYATGTKVSPLGARNSQHRYAAITLRNLANRMAVSGLNNEQNEFHTIANQLNDGSPITPDHEEYLKKVSDQLHKSFNPNPKIPQYAKELDEFRKNIPMIKSYTGK